MIAVPVPVATTVSDSLAHVVVVPWHVAEPLMFAHRDRDRLGSIQCGSASTVTVSRSPENHGQSDLDRAVASRDVAVRPSR